MKQRSREINIFSISALDLFASALGAFILMSIVFMVFFKMTAQTPAPPAPPEPQAEAPPLPECPEVPAPEPVECPEPSPDPTRVPAEALAATEAELAACESRLAGTEAQLADTDAQMDALATYCTAMERRASALEAARMEVRIPPLDIVICMDITASMSEQIEGLKQEINDLARVLDRLAPSVGIGVVAYGDRVFDRVVEKHPIVRTDAMRTLQQFVNALQPNGGSFFRPNQDLPEAVDQGLAEAVAMNWRPESERRYIIVVGDASAYPEEVASAYARAARFAATPGQHVAAVMVARRDAEQFFRQLAASGQGQFVDDVGGQSMIAAVLLAILDV